jgi:very-short-patch-repair endonuclease
MNRYIVRGQKVDADKVRRAEEFRHQMTDEERTLWRHLRANRLHGFHFRRQQLIDGFIVDFYCHAAGLIVEVDGPVHQQQAGYDAERDRVLAARDLRILRIRNEEVRQDLQGVLDRILTEVQKEGDHV